MRLVILVCQLGLILRTEAQIPETIPGASVTIKDNNGSSITKLSMMLYSDVWHQEMLFIPRIGLYPGTKIYVAVKATNLTDRCNVLLDRCYASTSPIPLTGTSYDLFAGCKRNAQTKVVLNGESQHAYFCFEVFTFENHKHQEVSTFYLHCDSRLCEASACSSLKPDCGYFHHWWKREAQYVSESVTVTSPAIRVSKLSRTWTGWLPPNATNFPSFIGAEKHHRYPQEDSIFDVASSLSCNSCPLVAFMICSVILSVFFSI